MIMYSTNTCQWYHDENVGENENGSDDNADNEKADEDDNDVIRIFFVKAF